MLLLTFYNRFIYSKWGSNYYN